MADKALQAEGRKLEPAAGMVWLVEVEIPSTPITRVRITSNNNTVNFGLALDGTPIPYYPYPLKVGTINRNKQGDLPQVQVAVSNVRREVMTYLHSYNGLVGQPADVRLVSLTALTDPTGGLLFSGEVVSSESSHDSVTFSIGTYNIKNIVFPRRRFVAHHCRHIFGSPECGYDKTHPLATFTTCGRTYADCVDRGDDEELVMLVARNHPKRFGGWRSLPIG